MKKEKEKQYEKIKRWLKKKKEEFLKSCIV